MNKTKNYDIIITEYDVNEVNMKDKTVLYKISQGMYVLSTKGASCFVDAVSQVSGGENPLVCVAVMKKNYTNEVMHKTNHFALMVFGKMIILILLRLLVFPHLKRWINLLNMNILNNSM